MPLVTTPGAANADSYVTLEEAAAYAAAYYGPVFTESLGEAVLRRATLYIDTVYRDRFTGRRTNRFAQSLEWPRVGAYLSETTQASSFGNDLSLADIQYLADSEIPIQIKNAVCEAAVSETKTPGTLFGTLADDVDSVPGLVKRKRAGDTEVEYFGVAPSASTRDAIPAVDRWLDLLLLPPQSYLVGRTVRF